MGFPAPAEAGSSLYAFQKSISLSHPFGSIFDEAIAPVISQSLRKPEPSVIHHLQGATAASPRLRPHDCTRHQRRLQPRDTAYFQYFSPPPATVVRPPASWASGTLPASDPYLRGRTFDRRSLDPGQDEPQRWLSHHDRSMDEVRRAARFGIMLDRRAQTAYTQPPRLEVVEGSYNPSWHNSRSVIKPGGFR